MFDSENCIEVGKRIQIPDDFIAISITCLFEKYNYNVITKKDIGIYFQSWSNRL